MLQGVDELQAVGCQEGHLRAKELEGAGKWKELENGGRRISEGGRGGSS